MSIENQRESSQQTLTVLLSHRAQWRRVAEAIADPGDVLIVEGFPTMDPQSSVRAVFAANAKTEKWQMAEIEA